jgi:ATP adenylyltransferase
MSRAQDPGSRRDTLRQTRFFMTNLWAPWRLQYVTDTAPKEPGCFFCNAFAAGGDEKRHLLLARGERAFVLMNRYPYNNGHLMVAPVAHVGEVEAVDAVDAAEMWSLTVLAKNVLAESMRPDGFNVGINQGKCAGAGVLDHLHTHIVPRWEGDTNFMPVLADIKVMPQALEDAWEQLRPGFEARGY